MMKATCVDASNRPESIPLNKWLVKDKEYTITRIDRMNMQGGLLGCQVAEIDTSDCFPHTHFALSRFRIVKPVEQEELVNELVES